ncbi:hypothetical protein K3495_g4432 [Podosphaera aphanis]|nr:hypothetical protein K3495_g4432 [Podosphaera aphanis]
MKSSFVAASILLSSLISAQPHRHRHMHPARHAKREESAPVVWVTDWVSVVKTVELTTTVWVSPETAAPMQTPSSPESSPQELSHPSAIADKALQSFPTPTSTAQSSASAAENLPAQNHVVPAPIAAATAEASIPEVHPASLSAAAEEPTTTSEADLIITTLAAAHASPSPHLAGAEHAASGGQCSPAAPCNGDITYYDPGVGFGACGWMNNKDEPVVALPFGFMGSQSNGNSLCGKTITIEHDGKTSTAKVVDKCMGCTGFSIDLSNAVFSQLSSLSVGRTSAKWWIN